MLVLTRNLAEAIKIGDNITIRVLRVTNNTVQLGISAPGEVEVHRSELYQKIQQQKKQNT
ncbi:carbon storage regulator [Pseudomonas arsenicoxydans]|uniref:Translational regulator CsrA n=2 Tax=Pseudomonas arsenicoxydans TaxID=702115 RepID=A0A502GXL4_9PSED|nr:carbon storage regulator CsrA [Pseudomonas arsenicoxydans]TPG65703.1 carbon storage regulator [Pseudomonas arsenicoxydans]